MKSRMITNQLAERRREKAADGIRERYRWMDKAEPENLIAEQLKG